MAKARILAPWVGNEQKSATYHCVSRVVERQFHFGKVEKEQFVTLMRLYEAFCGVKVLSYCIMSNHFHLLVEVPPRPEVEISDAELLRRLAMIQSRESVASLRGLLEGFQSAEEAGELTPKGRKAREALREKYLSRMWDLGQFMKTLKQRFSRWFNTRHERKGTLWEERYSSSLVEDGYAAMVTSAYIDLNPVRAGMVTDPKNYRWCSYAEAVAGDTRARKGIAEVMHKNDTRTAGNSPDEDARGYGWRSIAGRYRLFLYGEGQAPGESQQAQEVQGKKHSKRKGFTNEQIERERKRDGHLGMAVSLQGRMRGLIDGAVIGSRGFVDGVITQLNEQGYWPKPRKTGASRMNSLANRGKTIDKMVGKKSTPSPASSEIWSLRHLQKE